MKGFVALLPLLSFAIYASTARALEACQLVERDPCICRTQDGHSIDLHPLNNVSSFHSFPGIYGVFHYAWSPCSDTFIKPGDLCTRANDAAACQSYNQTLSQPWFLLGRANTADFQVNLTNSPPTVTVHYSGGTPSGSVPRETTVDLVCSPALTPGTIYDLGPDPHLHYRFRVESKHACVRSPGTTCKRLDGSSCVCQLEDERLLNLTALNNVFHRVIGNDGLVYSWGPCGRTLNEGDFCTLATNAAVCQGVGGRWFSLGEASTADFSVESSAIPFTASLSYTGGTDHRQSKVTVICDETAEPGRLEEVYEDPPMTFNFILSSVFACPVRMM